MAKNFIPRVAKKDRKTIEIKDLSSLEKVRFNDQRLLQGARLAEIELNKISVKRQVRTKFDDDSLRELAENIRLNGLIQPLVLHQEEGEFLLLCGERRFRAMQSINMKRAPCFILEGKTQDELMAIQFSENSSREELHYIDKADGIFNYKKTTDASERKIVEALGISKSDVHRALIIATLPTAIKEAAKAHNIEKYLLLEFLEITDKKIRDLAAKKICSGEITKRTHLKNFFELHNYKKVKAKSVPQVLGNTIEKSRGGKNLKNDFFTELSN